MIDNARRGGRHIGRLSNKRRRRVKTVKRVASITALAAAGVAMFPTVASAHHPSASDSCEGLSVDMTSYPGPGTPNHLTVTIDDVVVLDTAFGESFSETFPWS